MLLGAIADDFTGATDLCSMLVRGGMRTVQLIGVPQPGRSCARRRCRRRRVEVAHRAGAAGDRGKPRRTRLAARRRLPAVLLQVLLHLRQHRRRQYRSGRRCADRRTRLRLRACLSGVPGECAQRLSGPSVRRRHSAQRERHGAPSADADDRRQPGARAVAADRWHGGPRALRHRRARRHRDPTGDDRAEGAGPPLRHRRCGERRASGRDRRGGRTPRADHRRFRRRDGTAGEFPCARACCRNAAMPPHCRRCRATPRCSRAPVRAPRWRSSAWRASMVPVLQLDPLAQPDAAQMVATARAWMADKLGATPIVIAASAPPDKVAALQQMLGRDGAGALIEQTLAHIAEDLVARGVRRLVVAGGETAGAVVSRLGVRSLRIGARDRSRRALDLCRRRHHAAAAGVEVGQLRRARLLPQGFRGAAMIAGSSPAMTIGGRAFARNQT